MLFPVTDPPEIVTVPPSRTLFACNMPELVTARILAVLTVLLSIVMPFAVIEAPLLTNTVSSANNVIVFGMLITTVPFTATFAALIVMLLFAPLTLRLPDRIKPFGSVICPVALSVTVPEDVGRSRPGSL